MKYLIKDTTKEERRQIVNRAFAITLTGTIKPSKKAIKLAEAYIEGKLELDAIRNIIIREYKKND